MELAISIFFARTFFGTVVRTGTDYLLVRTGIYSLRLYWKRSFVKYPLNTIVCFSPRLSIFMLPSKQTLGISENPDAMPCMTSCFLSLLSSWHHLVTWKEVNVSLACAHQEMNPKNFVTWDIHICFFPIGTLFKGQLISYLSLFFSSPKVS